MTRRVSRLVVGLVIIGMLSSCGGSAPSEADIQATIAAGVRATTMAQQQAANATTAATSTPVDAPTNAPFTPEETIETAEATATNSTATAQTTSTAASATAAPVDEEPPPAATPIVFNPETSAGQQQTINIELVFDSSGSMAENIGGETRIEAARRAMLQTIDQLPDNVPNFNVGFRVFGHKGDNTDAGKAESCASTELRVPVQGVNKDILRQETNAYMPVGWTPISLALQKAGEDLKAGENTKNVIIMVTDGEETCEGDPCAVSKALAESGAEVRIDVVGFGLTPDVARNLKCISENSGGSYTDAQDGGALTRSLQELIAATVKRSYLRVVAAGPDGKPLGEGHPWRDVVGMTSLTDAQGQRAPVAEGLIAGEGRQTPLENKGEQRFELPPGTYQFTITQQLGWNSLRGDLPLVNAEQRYTAQVGEGQETVAIVGVGALVMTAQGGDPEYACDLELDVAYAGKWQTAYPVVEGFCSRSGNIVQGGDLAFDREYPLLPGRYRLRDARRNNVLADDIVIEPGKTVTVQIQGLQRLES